MPTPAEVTPFEHSLQHHQAARDAQHAIAAKPDVLWPFGAWAFLKDYDGEKITAPVIIDYYFMDGTEKQKKAVRSTVERKLKPPGVEFDTWEDCANVKFRHIDSKDERSQIRITFKVVDKSKPKLFDSALGMDALNYPSDRATMRLIGIAEKYPPSKEDRGIILHEFGHVLGLDHEHQSPTLEGYLGATLDEKAIIKSYHGDEARARAQVIDKVQNPTNYTRFDKDSIMLYDIESRWKTGFRNKLFGKTLTSNNKLSELDRAFIRLMYPPDLSIEDSRPPFLQAMHTAGVPPHVAGQILSEFVQKKGLLIDRLNAVRNKFTASMEGWIPLFEPNQALLPRAIDPIALRRSGVTEFVGEATKNKLFQAIVKNVVYRTIEQSGAQTKVSLPGSTQAEVMRMLGALAMHNSVGQSVKYYDVQLSKKSDVDVPSTVTDPSGGIPEETKNPLDIVKPDLDEWKKAEGSATVWIKKREDQREITLDILSPLGMQVVLTSNKESARLKNQNIDARGVLYYRDQDVIETATKARWTCEWVVFYRDAWQRKNFIACLIPIPTDSGSVTDLVSAEEDFENVRWEKAK